MCRIAKGLARLAYSAAVIYLGFVLVWWGAALMILVVSLLLY